MYLTIFTITVFACLFLFNMLYEKKYKKDLKNRINEQNKDLVFIKDISIKDELFKDKAFFKMHDSNKKPCDFEKNIEIVYYSTPNDYWIKRC